ncbi:MAG: tetratricopeptide repeat protein [Ignavibacteriae bacterium]|nr:tetratricopeptide repeat protein [Ignavibacteriota bacterium]
MIPNITCRNCGAEVASSDRFCSSCGQKTDRNAYEQAFISSEPIAQTTLVNSSETRCSLCGQYNPASASYCESCGNALTHSSKQSSKVQRQEKQQAKRSSFLIPLTFFQSWKLTVALAVLFVFVIVILKATRRDDPHTSGISPHTAELINEIETLQKRVDNNPNDTQALLRLANVLHDVKFFPRAIEVYERYLELDPSDPDARVDLGISYFELSMADTVRGNEYIQAARNEMEKALRYAPQHQLALFNLGIVSLHSGDIEEANGWFKKCIAINPNTESAKKAQQLLNQHSFKNPS